MYETVLITQSSQTIFWENTPVWNFENYPAAESYYYHCGWKLTYEKVLTDKTSKMLSPPTENVFF